MVTDRSSRPWSDLPIPPGELLEEELEALGMTQQELALRAGRPAQVINEIIRGKKAITHDTALGLERVLGIPAHVWINLEADYRLAKARERERQALQQQEFWLASFPVHELERRGWMPRAADRLGQVGALLSFLGVATFDAWRQSFATARLRVTPAARVSDGVLACWLRQGEIEGAKQDTQPYDEQRFTASLQKARNLTRVRDPDVFFPQLKSLCNSAGVAVALIREFPKSGANGAARWLSPTKGLIQLSLRYRWSDIFWFTFFHEACHLLNHAVKDTYVDLADGKTPEEEEADRFAADVLISPAAWREFRAAGTFTSAAAAKFATDVGVSTSIVVGRLQHEGLIRRDQLNAQRVRFDWSE